MDFIVDGGFSENNRSYCTLETDVELLDELLESDNVRFQASKGEESQLYLITSSSTYEVKLLGSSNTQFITNVNLPTEKPDSLSMLFSYGERMILNRCAPNYEKIFQTLKNNALNINLIKSGLSIPTRLEDFDIMTNSSRIEMLRFLASIGAIYYHHKTFGRCYCIPDMLSLSSIRFYIDTEMEYSNKIDFRRLLLSIADNFGIDLDDSDSSENIKTLQHIILSYYTDIPQSLKVQLISNPDTILQVYPSSKQLLRNIKDKGNEQQQQQQTIADITKTGSNLNIHISINPLSLIFDAMYDICVNSSDKMVTPEDMKTILLGTSDFGVSKKSIMKSYKILFRGNDSDNDYDNNDNINVNINEKTQSHQYSSHTQSMSSEEMIINNTEIGALIEDYLLAVMEKLCTPQDFPSIASFKRKRMLIAITPNNLDGIKCSVMSPQPTELPDSSPLRLKSALYITPLSICSLPWYQPTRVYSMFLNLKYIPAPYILKVLEDVPWPGLSPSDALIMETRACGTLPCGSSLLIWKRERGALAKETSSNPAEVTGRSRTLRDEKETCQE